MQTICHQTVHCGQPCGSYIAEPGDLKWGWLPREKQQALAGVSHEIDEHIDPISLNQRGNLQIRKSEGDPPATCRSTETRGVFIVVRAIRVICQFTSRTIELLEPWQHQKSGRILP